MKSIFYYQSPYNSLQYTAVDRFGNDVASQYVDVVGNTGEIYIKRSLTLISNNQLIVSITHIVFTKLLLSIFLGLIVIFNWHLINLTITIILNIHDQKLNIQAQYDYFKKWSVVGL